VRIPEYGSATNTKQPENLPAKEVIPKQLTLLIANFRNKTNNSNKWK
jgi:hypothetical protein